MCYRLYSCDWLLRWYNAKARSFSISRSAFECWENEPSTWLALLAWERKFQSNLSCLLAFSLASSHIPAARASQIYFIDNNSIGHSAFFPRVREARGEECEKNERITLFTIKRQLSPAQNVKIYGDRILMKPTNDVAFPSREICFNSLTTRVSGGADKSEPESCGTGDFETSSQLFTVVDDGDVHTRWENIELCSQIIFTFIDWDETWMLADPITELSVESVIYSTFHFTIELTNTTSP